MTGIRKGKFGAVIKEEFQSGFKGDEILLADEYLNVEDYADFYKDMKTGVLLNFFINIPWATIDAKTKDVPIYIYLFYPLQEGTTKIDKDLIDKAMKDILERFQNRMNDILVEYGMSEY